MRSGDRAGSRRSASRKPRTGSSAIASSGSSASIASRITCANYRRRTRRMTKGNKLVAPPADRTLSTTRVFDAPRELVFKAWTDPKQFARWFPPQGFSAAACELDVRPGGSLRFDMKGADPSLGPDFYEKVFPGRGVYREVVANERLAFTFEAAADESASPLTMLMTVIFEDEGG